MQRDNIIFIFDFDGIVVDSINQLYNVYLEFLSEFGYNGNTQEFNMLDGKNILEIVTYLKEKYAIKKDQEELLKIYNDRVYFAYKKVNLNEDIVQIFKALRKKNIKIALASSCKKNIIQIVFNEQKLNDYFDFVITGDDTKNSKPSPEIYNHVKQRYPNYKYYVVEDSENGVQAAMKAGMNTILYNPKKKDISSKVNYDISSLNQIYNIIIEIEYNCFTIANGKDISLNVVEQRSNLDTKQRDEIEHLWHSESKKKSLFNGSIVSYKSHYHTNYSISIDCFITEYKFFLAQLKNPKLNLGIIPISVSGVILDEENNTLIGLRHNVTEYKGYYEFIPSGSIDSSKIIHDKVLYQEQLITEFEEETSISKDYIKNIVSNYLIYDKNHNVIDVCSIIYIKGLLNNLLKESVNIEYGSIRLINLHDIHIFFGQYNLVPTSHVLYKNII